MDFFNLGDSQPPAMRDI